ncbi:MAG: 4-alpha-glucanotransferase [Faecalimonas sp.]|nr:4-alpha-glucanotransferase [Faecalimonas sp.]
MTKKKLPRVSGILLHPTSLPSAYGIGDLGPEAYAFIDFLEKAGQHLWQTLPLTPTGFGDSPYQSFSAFAGQPLIISPELLVEQGLLRTEELYDCPRGDGRAVDYGTIIPWKTHILRLAFARFAEVTDKELLKEYKKFRKENDAWLEDYALYMSCKDKHEGRCWLDWEKEYRQPNKVTKAKLLEEFAQEMEYYYFVQFIFNKQWTELRAYANEKDIKIIGDIPLFMSLDSADVWANQSLFQLDSKGYPLAVAGVPPDYFSATGQLWGNPLYDWKAHKKTGYAWWIARIRKQLELADYVRIDHFRGLDEYWAVPAEDETAENGAWEDGPKDDLFLAIAKELGEDLPIIAEDLGTITQEVRDLRDRFGLPGMKILQFAFEATDESSFLPHQFQTTNCVCYTGTHDNNTTKGWYANAPEYARDKVRCYMNTDGGNVHWDFLRTCFGTVAAYAVVPLQDVLGIGEEGRMNTPGVAAQNWAWRYEKELLSDGLAEGLLRTTRLYGR